jgi:hypothetical protein
MRLQSSFRRAAWRHTTGFLFRRCGRVEIGRGVSVLWPVSMSWAAGRKVGLSGGVSPPRFRLKPGLRTAAVVAGLQTEPPLLTAGLPSGEETCGRQHVRGQETRAQPGIPPAPRPGRHSASQFSPRMAPPETFVFARPRCDTYVTSLPRREWIRRNRNRFSCFCSRRTLGARRDCPLKCLFAIDFYCL